MSNPINTKPNKHTFILTIDANQDFLSELMVSFITLSKFLNMDGPFTSPERISSRLCLELPDSEIEEINNALRGGFETILKKLKKETN